MARSNSIFFARPAPGVQADAARWIAGTLALTALVWLASFAGLLAISNRVHDDVPANLAAKLPLLQLRPELIFAGDSRTYYEVDPGLASELMDKPPGAAINIAYEAGEPLAVLAAIHLEPERFEHARLVINLTAPILNEGGADRGVESAGRHRKAWRFRTDGDIPAAADRHADSLRPRSVPVAACRRSAYRR